MAIFKESKIKTSILVTLTLLFFFIGVIPLLISNWKLISINREALETTLRENFVTTAEGVSTQIGDYIKFYRAQIQEFRPKAGERIQTSIGLDEPPTLMKDPNILKVRILSPQGKGPYAQKFNFQDPQIPSLEFEAFKQASQGKSYLGSPYYNQVDDIPILLIAEPLMDKNDKIVGVLSVVLSLNPLLKIIDEQSAGGKRMYVVDSEGNLLLHPDRAQMMAHPNLKDHEIVGDYGVTKERVSTVSVYKEKHNGKTVEILGSHSPVPDLKWGVIIQIEKSIALASVKAMIKESAKWGIIFALAACIVGLFLARWITRPIQDLAQHALNIGRNQNFEQKIELQASNEIQQLADTFNFMTEEIRQNITRLQTAARENKELFMSSIRMLAAAIDAKDPYTRGHSERVKDFALIIARSMGFNEAEIERVEIAALLHDVGKIGIEDRILRKPTNLTPEEFEVMKTHPEKGANILSQIAQLSDIVPSTRAHHENFDGSGYPKGLRGEQIPIIARVITVADTFDAMTTDRPYQKAFTLEFALNRIRTMVNVKYDPKVVEAFSRACEAGKVALHKPSRPRPKQAVV